MITDRSEENQEKISNWIRILIAASAALGLLALIYVGYRIHHKDMLASQADSFARTFIQDSPIIQRELGHVNKVKEIGEQHKTAERPGWYLDYAVDGSRSNGRVDMRLTPSENYASWNIDLANLQLAHKSLSLR